MTSESVLKTPTTCVTCTVLVLKRHLTSFPVWPAFFSLFPQLTAAEIRQERKDGKRPDKGPSRPVTRKDKKKGAAKGKAKGTGVAQKKKNVIGKSARKSTFRENEGMCVFGCVHRVVVPLR